MSLGNGIDTLQVLYRHFKMVNELVIIQVFWSLVTRFYNLTSVVIARSRVRPFTTFFHHSVYIYLHISVFHSILFLLIRISEIVNDVIHSLLLPTLGSVIKRKLTPTLSSGPSVTITCPTVHYVWHSNHSVYINLHVYSSHLILIVTTIGITADNGEVNTNVDGRRKLWWL